jgi:hypothetical protein
MRFSFFYSCKHNFAVTLIVILICAYNANSQVYNYFPLTYNNIESNPSAINAKVAPKINTELFHTANKNKQLSGYQINGTAITDNPIGLGVTMGANRMNNLMGYSYLGVATSSKINLKGNNRILLGLTYKVVESYAVNPSFDYYITNITPGKESYNHNFNVAVTFSDTLNNFYLSANVLNVLVPFVNSNSSPKFPLYYVLHAGNLANVFSEAKMGEISFMAISRLSPIDYRYWFSYYANASYQFNISKLHSLQLGTRIGFTDNSYWHLIPYLTFIINDQYGVKLSYSTHKNKSNFDPVFASNFQISLFKQTFTRK